MDPKDKAPLIDILSEGTIHLCERSGEKKDGRIRVEGEFGRWDRATANKRLYPKSLWESNIKRLSDMMANRKVLGELDHPSDGKTLLQRASHMVTKLWIEDDGRIMGEAEIVPTRTGKDLEAFFRAGVPIGISSRGYGSLKQNSQGEDVVQSDYKLVTFDFVAEPADNTAYPEVFFEGVEFPMATETTEKDLEQKFAKAVLDGAEPPVSMEDLKKEFEVSMLSRIADMKASLRDEVRKEFLDDPAVAKAKTALEGIAEIVGSSMLPDDLSKIVQQKDDEIATLQREIQERDLQLEEAQEQIEALMGAAKLAGYKYHLENLIRESEDAELLRHLVGDVSEYDSTGALTERVEVLQAEIQESRETEQRAYEKLHAAELQLKKKNEALDLELREAREANRALALKLYAEKKLRNHPQSKKIKAVLERIDLASKDQVDEIIEDFRDHEDAEDYEDVRNRIRRTFSGGRTRSRLDEEETPRVRPDEGNYKGLGAPLTELKKLSGISRI
jgi:hypothetical protein